MKGIQEVKDHPFFSEINWRALEMREPQEFMRRPPLEVEISASNFDDIYTKLAVDVNINEESRQNQTRKQSISLDEQKLFSSY